MKPILTDAIRFPSGSRLRLELTLKPLLREAAEKALQRYGTTLADIEQMRLVVHRNDADGGHVSGALQQATASVSAARADGGDYVFVVAAAHTGRERNAEARDVMLQIVGSKDVYFSRATEDGPMPIARLRYSEGEGSFDSTTAALSVFTQSFAQRVPSALRSLLPTELQVARLTAAADAAPADIHPEAVP
jgi:hypothetical protein